MSSIDSLTACVAHASRNGFSFRPWFLTQSQQVWPGPEGAIEWLATEGHYYALIFSHEFASYFWREGSTIQFRVPAMTYSRVNPMGEIVQVSRKSFTRRTNRHGVWVYHLRQMVSADDPLEYLCRFLVFPENAEPSQQGIAMPS